MQIIPLVLFWLYNGGPPKMEFIYKKCVFILTCLNFGHLQSTLHLTQYTYQGFFHCSKQFLNALIFRSFSTSAIVCFTSSTSAKCFPLRSFFIQETKQSCLRLDWVNREGGELGLCCFWSKTAEHSGVGRCARK